MNSRKEHVNLDAVRKWALSGLLAGLSLVLIIYAAQPRVPQSLAKDKKDLKWYTEHEETIKEASRAGKNVFMAFSASWCPACQKMESETLKNTEVQRRLANDFIAVKIDVDTSPVLSSRYRIYGVPKVIILDPSGNEIGRREGYMSPDELISYLG